MREPRGGKKFDLTGLDEDLIGDDLFRRNDELELDGDPHKLFGKYDLHQTRQWLAQAGLYRALEARGYRHLETSMELAAHMDQRIYIRSGKEILVHIRLKLSRFKFRFHDHLHSRILIYIDWLLTRDPHKKKVDVNRLFPGQDVPGLGVFSQIAEFIRLVAGAFRASGAFNLPEYFHDALLFQRRFRFYDPEREGFFRALIRELHSHGAREISRALTDGRLVDDGGTTVQWHPGEMLSLSEPGLDEQLWTPKYYKKVEEIRKNFHFRIQPP